MPKSPEHKSADRLIHRMRGNAPELTFILSVYTGQLLPGMKPLSNRLINSSERHSKI